MTYSKVMTLAPKLEKNMTSGIHDFGNIGFSYLVLKAPHVWSPNPPSFLQKKKNNISKSQGAGTDVVFRIHVRSLVGIHLVGVHKEEIRLARC